MQTTGRKIDSYDVRYRFCVAEDAPLILQFIRELAEYEKLLHEITATEDLLRETLFGPDAKAFVIIATCDGAPAGFALCFYNYSTFQGKPGIYIEDLYVRPEYRGEGIGKGFFRELCRRAKKEGCGRVQWWVLDWNEPSIRFYENLGAKPMDEWTVFRLEGEAIDRLAG